MQPKPTRPTPIELHVLAIQLWTPAGGDPDADVFADIDRHLADGEPVSPSSPKNAVKWITAVHGYEQFWRCTGSTPRENTRDRAQLPAEERRMGEWARYQRRFEDTRNSFQKARLDASPAFHWDPLEHVWSANFDACVQHVLVVGRLPVLNGDDPQEFALARWVGRQARLRKVGRLSGDRRTRFDDLLLVAQQR